MSNSVWDFLAAGVVPESHLGGMQPVFNGWDAGYIRNTNWLTGKQLFTEASASLPGIVETPSPETVFDGMELQRLRLHHDQQVPEWE